MIWTGLPVVSCPYMPAAEMPMPCCPRLMRSRWNLDPYRSFAKIGGICWRMMPGPLSVTVIRKRLAWLAGGGASPLATASTLTTTSGRIPASSQASRALSTASFTHVSSAFRGLSNPRRCRFLVKNSETEISRWRAPISTVDTEGDAGRKVCLDQSGDDIHGRALGGDDQVNPRRPSLLGQASDELFSRPAKHQDQVGKFIDEKDHIGQGLPLAVEVRKFAATSCADGRVEPLNISRLEGEHHLVAILHLRHQTVEDGFGLGLHVADHRAGKVGQVL